MVNMLWSLFFVVLGFQLLLILFVFFGGLTWFGFKENQEHRKQMKYLREHDRETYDYIIAKSLKKKDPLEL